MKPAYDTKLSFNQIDKASRANWWACARRFVKGRIVVSFRRLNRAMKTVRIAGA
jgi:hypothetical protein